MTNTLYMHLVVLSSQVTQCVLCNNCSLARSLIVGKKYVKLEHQEKV